jgi:hypothetical protein
VDFELGVNRETGAGAALFNALTGSMTKNPDSPVVFDGDINTGGSKPGAFNAVGIGDLDLDGVPDLYFGNGKASVYGAAVDMFFKQLGQGDLAKGTQLESRTSGPAPEQTQGYYRAQPLADLPLVLSPSLPVVCPISFPGRLPGLTCPESPEIGVADEVKFTAPSSTPEGIPATDSATGVESLGVSGGGCGVGSPQGNGLAWLLTGTLPFFARRRKPRRQ